MKRKRPSPAPLPMTLEEAGERGMDDLDIILVTGDAYVDHPAFGTAVIGRVLEAAGYRVGIIAQPDWRSRADFQRLGRPRLFFGVSSGNVDSMVNNYTAAGRRRRTDAYSPGGIPRRPDRAAIVYADRLHALFPGVPIVLGGLEASLRRFAHYDYWSDRVRKSILADAPADLLVYGMGERQVVEIARRLSEGEGSRPLVDIRGTSYRIAPKDFRETEAGDIVILPSFAEVSEDPAAYSRGAPSPLDAPGSLRDPGAYARAFALHSLEQDPVRGRRVAQDHGKTVIVQNPPAIPLSTEELDRVYELPYTRRGHLSYREEIPALEPVRFSLVSHRGCFGGCSFCAIGHHQGRIIQSRSPESLVRETRRIVGMKGFAGVIQDLGGPTANMYGFTCARWTAAGTCEDRFCSLDCGNLVSGEKAHLALLRRIRAVPGVKKVFIASGIRHDLIDLSDLEYLTELCAHHVGGHLKVAPEHISPRVLSLMRKPGRRAFDEFRRRFAEVNRRLGKEQYLLPYFMSGHPGCTVADMVDLAEYIRDESLYTEQAQDFTPTPMTAATCMYYTGIDPFTGEEVHVPRGREKEIQRAMLQYRDPAKAGFVREGLRIAGREDLAGSAWNCLVPAETGTRKREKRRYLR
ncbi:MAG TPA: YgiQ family radical SAM protein [Methanomicrobiales archaeon]|nr:YgiQ family radical SAM protein [Methanomicrobiales archaeon]